jgi:hypothetical protein
VQFLPMPDDFATAAEALQAGVVYGRQQVDALGTPAAPPPDRPYARPIVASRHASNSARGRAQTEQFVHYPHNHEAGIQDSRSSEGGVG